MALTKEERFRARLAREGLAVAASHTIPRLAGPREGEASFAQRRIWVNQMLDRQSTVYNILLALSLDGRLNVEALTQAVRAVVDRHEALRTSFTIVKGTPHQRVAAAVPVVVREVDLTASGPGAEPLADAITRAQRTPFPLERAPLFDFSLLRLSEQRHVLLITLHHIIFDFVSGQVLFDEIGQLYAGYEQGTPATLPDLRIQYLDYSAWQRGEFEQARAREALDYWKATLGTGDEIPTLDVPGDRPQGDAAFEPAVAAFELPRVLAARVAAIGRELELSPFCVWLAAFQLLLHRYTDADDVLVCVPHAERDDPELERAIGFFVNFIPLRLRVRRREGFNGVLRAVQAGYLEAVSGRSYPFDKLVEALAPTRAQGRTRLGEIGFGYQRMTRGTWTLGGLRVAFLDGTVPIAKSELSLSIYEAPDACRAAFEYNAARFSPGMMARMAEHYPAFLARLLDDPLRPIGAVPCATPLRRRDAIARLLADDPAEAPARSLTQPFEAQARTTPDRAALVLDGETISYGGLNRRANQIARILRARGVRPCDAVGVRLPRGVDAYACLLAVLQAGGVYVPMDRAHPVDYLRAMIRTADVTHVIAEGDDAVLREATGGGPVHLLDIAAVRDASRAESGRHVGLALAAAHPAYVCFTSGSTGESKGIRVAHGPAAAHLASFLRAVAIHAEERVLQFSALTFDVSIEQIFSAWSSGATLVARGDDVWGVREFVERVEQEQVAIANPPTAYWNEVVRVGVATGLQFTGRALRYMIAGGEVMRIETAQLWRRMCPPDVRLINAYGPTESVITATLHHVPAALDQVEAAGGSIAIGGPLAGRDALVLDRHGLPVPDGVPGELCLAGPALADGYLKSPRLTAAQFRPAPPPQGGRPAAAGARLYRTGDWVRMRPDGSFEFLQRKDDEVKIRGVRIVPRLIESTLLADTRIVEAAVIVREPDVMGAGTGTVAAPLDAERAYQEMLARIPPETLDAWIREAEAIDAAGAAGAATAVAIAAVTTDGDSGAAEAPAATAGADAGDASPIAVRDAAFALSVSFTTAGFIAPPRPAQRNWVINRALQECADDLRALDSLTRRFVAGSDRVEIQGDLQTVEPELDERALVMSGQHVMHDWQEPLMRELASAVTERHGDVLEIGFGLGLSATHIQARRPRSHVIVEANERVAASARRWRARHPSADIRIVHAKWQDVLDELDRFDGILFDTYPMTEAEFRTHVLADVTFAAHAFEAAARHLAPGGVFTYYTNEIDSLSRRHQRALLEAFSSFRLGIVRHLRPPADAQNWWADSMAVVRAYAHPD